MSKKVILLSGSPRRDGNTMQVLAEAARVMDSAGLETEVISLSGMRVASCIACGRCEELGECSQDDGLNGIIAKLQEARGFVVGSPVYFGTARGDLAAALQRIGMVSKSGSGFLSRMVGGPVAVARRGGHTATLQELLMFFLINDMVVAGSTYWNMVFGRLPGEALEDEEGIDTVRRFAENVAWLIDSLY